MNSASRIIRLSCLAALVATITNTSGLANELRPLEFVFVVEASQDDVWKAWTTVTGLETFAAREAIIELEAEGAFALHFAPDNPVGTKGAEDLSIMVVEPNYRLAFTWSAPPPWPRIRAQRTFVEVILAPEGEGTTRVTLRHAGWGEGQAWTEVHAYFAEAWKIVLGRLQYRFQEGPVDWNNPPQGLTYRSTDES